ncbi:glycosyl hydrolase catalytic core-domain-containing protein [Ephemerocybe angulata]|uniref:Glycosyl hydrolase catalytic core-domain-containing protein n=1 Tax=Ephemerocybe angulata TaxID=980116 RepID=A0A8H6M8S2_9AGAR|nr:glycosyl hydrolase catalytic core-domain-containing protein [Tulosesus angulatus]
MLPLSFLSVLTLALAVSASTSHLHLNRDSHHAVGGAIARRQSSKRCPARIRKSSTTAAAATTTTTSTSSTSTTTTSSSTSTKTQSSTTSITSKTTSKAPEPTKDTKPTSAPTNSGSQTGFTPNGNKAGLSAGDAYWDLKDKIGWWYDWSPNPSKPGGGPVAVPMLWGGGTADGTDAQRLSAFRKLGGNPPYVMGFEEPDCASGSGSAGMSVDEGVRLWEELMAPLKSRGTKLGSPSMCKQADETWLTEFSKKIKTPWDFTTVHVNKNNMDGVKQVIDHYTKFGKPIWVNEFACVADNPNFIPCSDQGEIDSFINQIVPYFESNPNIYAYAYSNGYGLGNVWPMWSNGKLSASGRTYLNAISKYH